MKQQETFTRRSYKGHEEDAYYLSQIEEVEDYFSLIEEVAYRSLLFTSIIAVILSLTLIPNEPDKATWVVLLFLLTEIPLQLLRLIVRSDLIATSSFRVLDLTFKRAGIPVLLLTLFQEAGKTTLNLRGKLVALVRNVETLVTFKGKQIGICNQYICWPEHVGMSTSSLQEL